MTNKDIALRIKALLAQNKYLRQKIKTLEIRNKDLQEWIDIDSEILKERSEFYSQLRDKYIHLMDYLKKVKHQRNYYNRMTHKLRRKIKILEENNGTI